MNKYGKIIFLFGIFVGIIVSGYIVSASSFKYESYLVGYDNNRTNFKDRNGNDVTDVQTAIDELYLKATSTKGKNNLLYFSHGLPTEKSVTDYKKIPEKIFIAKNSNDYSACVVLNNILHCFDYNNWNIEKDHIKQVFASGTCNSSSTEVSCTSSDNKFSCSVNSSGIAACSDLTTNKTCEASQISTCRNGS